MRGERVRERVRSIGVVARMLLALAAVVVVAPAPDASAQVVFDETVATVNGEVVTKSDLLWGLALDPKVPPSDFWRPATREMMLRTLVDQVLLLQEAAKLPATQVAPEEIAAARSQLAARFNAADDPNRFERRMRLVGLTGDRLDAILERRLRIEKYVDFRFRSFVVVTEPEVVQFFNAEIKPKLEDMTAEALGRELARVRADIERALTEEKINSAIDTYLEEARNRAEVVVFAESSSVATSS